MGKRQARSSKGVPNRANPLISTGIVALPAAYRGTDPDVAAGHGALARGERGAAAQAFFRALSSGTREASAYLVLARLLFDQGEAGHDNGVFVLERGRQVLPEEPRLAVALHEAFARRGEARARAGRVLEAVNDYRAALDLDDKSWAIANSLGICLESLGEHAAAEIAYRHAAALSPAQAGLWNNVALACLRLGKAEEARAALEQALTLDPRYVSALTNRAVLAEREGRIGAAADDLLHALACAPSLDERAALHANIAVMLRELGLLAESRRHGHEAATLAPGNPVFASSRLLGSLYDDTQSPEEIADHHRAWGARQGEASARWLEASHTLSWHSGERPLRVGFLSPDLRQHPVANFLVPLLSHRTPGRWELFAYADGPHVDRVSARIAERVDGWRYTRGLPDDGVAGLMADDRLDVLIDLAGHTRDNRLGLMARRQAPLQLSYIGYPATSGLGTIDGRITDAICDPPGMTEPLHTEALLRLPGGFLAFDPLLGEDEVLPAVTPPPCVLHPERGPTFGSFNNLAKVNDEVLRTWAALLRELPRARLLLKWRSLTDERARARVMRIMKEEGVAAERVELLGFVEGKRAHQALYQRLDVALDPFPYNGTTTTCEALLMGVPVVTLAGRAHVGRVGASLLARVGLESCVADSRAGYVAAAAALVARPDELAALRASLRARLEASALSDGARLARELEDAVEAFWQSRAALTTLPDR